MRTNANQPKKTLSLTNKPCSSFEWRIISLHNDMNLNFRNKNNCR